MKEDAHRFAILVFRFLKDSGNHYFAVCRIANIGIGKTKRRFAVFILHLYTLARKGFTRLLPPVGTNILTTKISEE